MSFSEKEEALVKESWEVLKQDIPEYSLRFFTKILEIAPAAKSMFSFLRDSDELPRNNPKLKAHAVKVFKMTCESAIQLREKGEVVVADTTLKYLGSVHLKNGVLHPHFEVVKEALLSTVKEPLEEKWNDEMGMCMGQSLRPFGCRHQGRDESRSFCFPPNTNSLFQLKQGKKKLCQ